jgi:hypothetical protein
MKLILLFINGKRLKEGRNEDWMGHAEQQRWQWIWQ